MSSSEKCNISKNIHISDNILGECFDCGSNVCEHCGFIENSIIKHNSEEYCFSNINILTSKVKYNVVKRRPRNKAKEKIDAFKNFLKQKK